MTDPRYCEKTGTWLGFGVQAYLHVVDCQGVIKRLEGDKRASEIRLMRVYGTMLLKRRDLAGQAGPGRVDILLICRHLEN